MLKDTSWGGEIEILILANFKKVQISIVAIASSTILTYSPEVEYSGRIYLLYNGQHYDAIVGVEHGQCVFSTGDQEIIEIHEGHAKACATALKEELEKSLKTRIRTRIKCLGYFI